MTPSSSQIDAASRRNQPWRLAHLLYILPLVFLVVFAVYFWIGLGRDSSVVPTVLLDRPVPEFDLAPIAGQDRGLSSADLQGQVSLVNIFGSWCVACHVEHPFLMALHKDKVIPIFGINWREKRPQDGPAWLQRYGNPYTLIGDDPQSRGAIAFGVSGAPETFIVDAKGYIRFKQIGPITPQIWKETLWPIVQRLRLSG